MALGKRNGERQAEFWVATQDLSSGPRHVFYDTLNQVLAQAGFDPFAEELCEPFYAQQGRPSIPPGVYFRMLFVGYFEGIDSQRGIAWRCEDSLSLRRFFGIPLGEETPDHSSLTRIRDRLPLVIHEQVFQRVLSILDQHGLLKGTTTGVDSTMLEANAAMKTIIRKDTGEDWKAYLKRLMQEEGLITKDEHPTDEELRKFDKSRGKQGKKKVSNDEWASPSDPDSRIVKMKDGRTHLGYKAQHVVDLDSEAILSARVQHGTDGDAQTLLRSVVDAQRHLILAESDAEICEIAGDKGYHANEAITWCTRFGLRTYIPEPDSPHDRRWTDKPDETRSAVLNNRQRMSRKKGKQLQRERSEKVERSFAHVCDTGGARRSWLRGLEKINKRYLIVTAARNLGLVLLKAFGLSKPRNLSAAAAAALALWAACQTICTAYRRAQRVWKTFSRAVDQFRPRLGYLIQTSPHYLPIHNIPVFSTGC